jgi:hypothetical protein
LVRNKTNWTNPATRATSDANKILPALEFGVVLGSEIMKKVNNSSAPFCKRWKGMLIGSPSQQDRPTSSAV